MIPRKLEDHDHRFSRRTKCGYFWYFNVKEELLPMFNSNIKQSPDREPKFRVKVDTTMEDQIKPNVFDADKNPLHDDATNGLYARNSGHAIVELNSVYFLNRKFGCTWKLYQLIVYEPQNLKGISI